VRGDEWRQAVKRALADQHKAARNRRCKRPSGMQRADFGAAGYRRESPSENSGENGAASGDGR
jgi:hypothetical protein